MKIFFPIRSAVLFLVLPFSTASFNAVTAWAAADDLYDRYFSNVLAGRPCFARTYDDTHSHAHAKQRVRSIEIDLSKANSDGMPNSSDRFALGFALMLKNGAEWYGQAASCKTSDEAFDCYLEADGGLFRLTPLADGGLRLETGDTGLSLEGAADTIELSSKEGDDRVFDLMPSKSECEAARAFLDGGNE
ncbi:hypothetical protein [Hyphomicrobium sp.]|jgi:hypothetical protein|uniref:hypothetical protein n=1 Tax=Hyphomicrobium sp. TaxID=82 RepID=UPI002C63052A|nr:hypothetical protein [Hyphomicrobium sp.]HVZ05357.1 hypothetical protein [Hyphomicrobium sp.]